jgi:hypothetical protein
MEQFTRQSKSHFGAHLSLVYVFRVIPLWNIHVWPIHYPGIHHCRNGGVSSDSATTSATKFIRPHKYNMRQYHSMLAHQGPNDAVLNRHRQGLPLCSSKHDNKLLSTLPVRYCPLFASFPPPPNLSLRLLSVH